MTSAVFSAALSAGGYSAQAKTAALIARSFRIGSGRVRVMDIRNICVLSAENGPARIRR